MNTFDKVCAGFAFALGVIFLILGVAGLFLGANAHFTLPPILGGLPALIGWGIIKAVMTAWRVRPNGRSTGRPTDELMTPPGGEL